EKEAIVTASTSGNADWELKFKNLNQDLNNWRTRFTQLETDKKAVESKLQAVESEKSKGFADWDLKFKNINNELTGFRARYATLETEKKAVESNSSKGFADWEMKFNQVSQQLTHFKKEHAALETKLQAVESEKSKGFADWDLKFKNLNQDLNNWRTRFTQLETDKKAVESKLQAVESEKSKGFADWDLKFKNINNELTGFRARYATLETEKRDIETKYTGGVSKIKDFEAKLAASQKEIADWKLRFEAVETLRTEMLQAKGDGEELRRRYYTEVESLVNDVEMYKSRYETLLNAQESTRRLMNDLETDRNRLSVEYGRLNDMYLSLRAESGGGSFKIQYESLLSRQQSYERLVADLEKELAVYRQASTSSRIISTQGLELNDEDETVTLERIKSRVKGYKFNFGIATFEERDNLERIKGIGKFTEKKLYALGIFTFRQLAAMTANDVKWLNESIEFFDGRIERDDWVGQAQDILGLRKKKKAKSDKDDLKKVEGIGPKIEALLHEAGIMTFEDLAQADVTRVKAILVAAGSRFQMHDPTTWGKQSALAAEGKWDELKALQDALNGGKE
ncbi:MAG: hypothetical protein RL757_415, partial [Bacteroidota bacterium]